MQCLNPDYMALSECAFTYGLHESTLRRYVTKGILSCLRIGGSGKLYLRRAQIEELVLAEKESDVQGR